MPFTMRQRRAWPLARRAAPVLGLGVLLGFAGPFGSHPPLSAPVRYAFWIGMVFVGYAAALAAEKLVPEAPVPRPLRPGAVAIASALPLTFVAAWVIPLLRPGHVYQPSQLPALFCIVAAVQLAIVFTLLRKSNAQPQPWPPSAQNRERSGAFPPALLSRLPSRLGQEIIALEAEDHYLRVHTTLGSDLVLMRLSDAIAAIEPDLGLQVHRSWWVAQDAICEVIRSEQRSHLKLRNGLLAPVGRTYSAAVRARAARLPPGD
ncbi:LytTR family DNA-binding domain-containing protein [Brevundimonas sp.]|uniref:LytTR family DNA-binding domain-containing protein n=1 Tax=Brevundimonas sp. TaxID=1871086 RepID=UPI003D6CC91B